jgi:iron complex outermembrane receptor protein
MSVKQSVVLLASFGLFLAQAAAEQAPDDDELQQVVVTGSRLASGFTAPTPLTAISADQLSLASPNDIATALAQAPSLSSSILDTNAGAAGASQGTNGQSLLNLRGLGINRTLVLLDGQRLGTTNVQDSVDINMIPQTLVKRVDIVTGGASATYGSDAVAGVVNFVLDTDYQGFKADINGGTTSYSDSNSGSVSVAFGRSFGDRFKLIASASAYKRTEVGLPPTGRNWDDDAWASYPNAVVGATPAILVLPQIRSSIATYGGLIAGVQGCATTACRALIGQQFATGGALVPFTQGAQPGASFTSGGDGAYVVNGISPEQNRQNAFVHAEFSVGPKLTLFGDGLFSRSWTKLSGHPVYESGTTALTIFPDNAFLTPALRAFFTANPTATSFTMGRMSDDIGSSDDTSLVQVSRLSLGAKGPINDNWYLDGAVAQQYTTDNLDIPNQIQRNVYAAADAVVNPANGQIVCRSTLAGLDPGCAPVNLFGEGAPSAAAVDYIMGENLGHTIFKQTSFDINLRGDLGERFSLGAGPLSVAMGFDYRRNTADRRVDALSNIYTSCAGLRGCPAATDGRYGGYQFYNPQALTGKTDAKEVYAEVGIPLLKELPLVKLLGATLAGRVTDYSIGGYRDSWKIGLQWNMTDSVSLRGTTSQDVRAPNVIELFNTGSTTVAQNRFPNSTAATQVRVTGTNFTRGNLDLIPESVRTATMGLVLSPTWAPGWQTSIDYYHVKISDAIESLSAQGIVDGCSAGNQPYCQLITVNGVPATGTTGFLATTTGVVVTAPTQNVGTESTSGVDLETAYNLRFGEGQSVTARLLGNYLLSSKRATAITGCPGEDVKGAIGGCLGADGYPRWTASLSLQYQAPRFSAYVRERAIAASDNPFNQVAGVTISRFAVPLTTYTDLSLDLNLGFQGNGKVFLNVTNLFNRDPPVVSAPGGAWATPTAYNIYDVLGRRYILGYRLNL